MGTCQTVPEVAQQRLGSLIRPLKISKSTKDALTMKTNTKFTIKLDLEEMTILRDLVRIGMKSKYYQNYSTEEIDDYGCENIRNLNVLAVMRFVNLNHVSQIETMFDDALFEGVTV